MNTLLKVSLIVVAVLVIVGGLFFAGQVYGSWQSGSQYGFWGMPMMRGYGWQGNQSNYGRGPMSGGGRGYGPMMGNGYGPGYTTNFQPLTVDEAKQSAQKYVDSLGLTDLSLGEVMIFDNNAYVVVHETSTGMGAFELLVDPATKVAYPEYGPNMMWNIKYGGLNHSDMMGGRGYGGMMGGGYGYNFNNTVPSNVSADMPVTQDQAIKDAQAYLDQYQPGTVAATDPVKFYGYYTLDFSKDGKVVGMLSVNGYSGEVFLHTWHGTFIEEAR
jgi:hypothetical protein